MSPEGVAAAERAAQDSWRRAVAAEESEGCEAAMPLYREVLARAPEDPAALLAVGRLLLARGEEEGASYVERAIVADPDAGPAGSDLLAEFWESRGDGRRAREARLRAAALWETGAAARAERSHLTAGDRFLPHGLPGPAIEPLRADLASLPEVARACLARKRLHHRPEPPLFALALWQPWLALPTRDIGGLAARVAGLASLPGETLVFVVNAAWLGRRAESSLGVRLRKLAGAEIYRR